MISGVLLEAAILYGIVSGGGDVCVNSNKLLIVTLLLLAGDVEVNPGPGGSSFFVWIV